MDDHPLLREGVAGALRQVWPQAWVLHAASGEQALQIAAQHAFELNARPSPLELLEIAERWRPWRGVAARVLWAWYPTLRNTKPGQPV